MTEYVQIATTVARKEEAERIARELVDRRLAACVQVIGPIGSTYRWQGQVESAEEWLCLAKSKQSLFAAVEQAIREVHPYEVPEILATPVVAGHAAYLEWLQRELRPD